MTTTLPLLGARDLAQPLAWRDGQALSAAQFLGEALALAVRTTRYGCNWHGGHKAYSQPAQQLLATVRRYPSFPIVLETYRQALRDVFDMNWFDSAMRSRSIAWTREM